MAHVSNSVVNCGQINEQSLALDLLTEVSTQTSSLFFQNNLKRDKILRSFVARLVNALPSSKCFLGFRKLYPARWTQEVHIIT